MHEGLIRESVKRLAKIPMDLIKVIGADLNKPDTNLFYDSLLEYPELKQRVERIIEERIAIYS